MNVNNYINSKKNILDIFFAQKSENRLQAISLISVCNHIPIIVCLFFLGEALDWPEDVVDNIKMLVRVYNYRDIEGVPESYPGEKI